MHLEKYFKVEYFNLHSYILIKSLCTGTDKQSGYSFVSLKRIFHDTRSQYVC